MTNDDDIIIIVLFKARKNFEMSCVCLYDCRRNKKIVYTRNENETLLFDLQQFLLNRA